MEERSEELSIVEAKRNDSSKREGFQVLLKKKKKKKKYKIKKKKGEISLKQKERDSILEKFMGLNNIK